MPFEFALLSELSPALTLPRLSLMLLRLLLLFELVASKLITLKMDKMREIMLKVPTVLGTKNGKQNNKNDSIVIFF